MVVYGASSWVKLGLAQYVRTDVPPQRAQNTLFLILGVVLLVAMSVMNLLDPAARCLGRTATAEYNGSPKLVFGVSLLVWASCACLTLILSASLTDYLTPFPGGLDGRHVLRVVRQRTEERAGLPRVQLVVRHDLLDSECAVKLSSTFPTPS